ncbi:MAG: sulfur oxidation c-type cytochrome SoxX [Bosea sp. (in: a-proteobacteria)]
MNLIKLALIATFATLSVGIAHAQTAPKTDPAIIEAYVAGTWKNTNAAWRARVVQDDTQKICTASNNEPSGATFDQIRDREKASVVFPADGKVLGDWKRGAQVAQRGTGGQFTDNDQTVRGGNCYACHQMSKAEVSFGTLGPPLTAYGKDRKFDPEEAKNAYAKVFNAMSVLPCSQMPRFGFHKFLSEEQIKDVVAYLFDPESPVNK